MKAAIDSALPSADVLIMAAAPADFRPSNRRDVEDQEDATLRRRSRSRRRPTFSKSTRGKRRHGSVVVGFALETNDVLANGRRKLASKDLDLIVVNDATEPGAGFGTDTNRVTLDLARRRRDALPLMSKS